MTSWSMDVNITYHTNDRNEGMLEDGFTNTFQSAAAMRVMDG